MTVRQTLLLWLAAVAVAAALVAAGRWTERVQHDTRARQDSLRLAARLDSVTRVGQVRANRLTAELAAAAARLDAAEAARATALAAADRHHASDTRLQRVLDSLSTDAERVPVLAAQVDTLRLEVADLRTVVAEDSAAKAQLRHQLALTDSLRQVDADQASARLDLARLALHAAQDSIARLTRRRTLFGLPLPTLVVGYGIHPTNPRRECRAAVQRLGLATPPCDQVSAVGFDRGLQATIGWKLPL